MKKLTIALMAHVDAGKTTLAEALLHVCGALRNPGRVDQGSAALDTAAQERARGITVFAGEACLSWQGTEINLLDTPGHVDFSPETERVLQAADAAVLVISGLDGVQSHTRSLWRLLAGRALPVLIFVSKMDSGRREKEELLRELQKELSAACLPADQILTPGEEAALLNEKLLDRFLAGETLGAADGLALVRNREAFPVVFGSGLKEEGIDTLLTLINALAEEQSLWEESAFSARVFKISYDEKGTRLTHIRCYSGRIRPRDGIPYGDGRPEEKIAQIRRYTGARFTQEESLSAGSCGVLTGLAFSQSGDAIGFAGEGAERFFEPVMRYSLYLPEDLSPEQAMPSLKKLAEEDPSLHLQYSPALGTIFVDLMGPVQGEILTALIRERFGWETSLTQGRILYKETLSASVEGVGHYEPLRHYAEVHLALSPLPRGSGILYNDADGGRYLAGDMRRLILGQLWQKQHRGVLTGSVLCDVQITLLGGRFHEKHTEGGDFREAAWRAVRQGLMRACAEGKLVLLEPYIGFEMMVPAEKLGRAFTDIQARSGSIRQDETPAPDEDLVRLLGRAPLSLMQDYAGLMAAYTGGRGRLKTWPDGYDLCHDPAAVISEAAYDPEADRENPPDSVFCAHGAGFSVPWDQVPLYMHLPYLMQTERGAAGHEPRQTDRRDALTTGASGRKNLSSREMDAELEAIMQREFGPIKRPVMTGLSQRFEKIPWQEPVELSGPGEYIVDGYNLIFAWEALKKLSEQGLDFAREQLERRLQNFAAFTGKRILLVFDGYRVPGSKGSQEERSPLEIVYTAENETADMHIERYLALRGKKAAPAVVSNDNLIRLSVIRQGGLRLPCEDFIEEYEEAMRRLSEMTAEEQKAFGAPAELPPIPEEKEEAP